MSKQQWIVPMAIGLLSLSLVGCGNTEMGTTREATGSGEMGTTMTATSTPRTTADNYNFRTSIRSGEQMVDDAHYDASADGSVKDGDATQEGCKNRHRDRHHLEDDIDQMGDDVERALRDVGRTMDDMRTDV